MTNNFSDFELAEDVKAFVSSNKDVTFADQKLKEQLNSFADSVLLKVTKSINSPTVIINIEQVNDEYIKSNF